MPFTYSDDPVPAPVLPVRVSPLESSAGSIIPGRIDTGADMTVIPDSLVRTLHLGAAGEIWVHGTYSRWQRRPTFWVRIALTDSLSFEVKALTSPRRNCLVGLDILNQTVLHADGSAKTFELGIHS